MAPNDKKSMGSLTLHLHLPLQHPVLTFFLELCAGSDVMCVMMAMYRIELSIMDSMKEKMYLSGSGTANVMATASWSDGTQRKTKRDPSKQVCVRPRTRSTGSAP